MNPPTARALLGACALGLVLCAQAEPPPPVQRGAVAVPATPEQQLDAVRRALVDEAMAGNTRVLSHAWIDGEGRLHEGAQFSSDLRVRGVRVRAYLQDDEERARAELALERQNRAKALAADPQAQAQACRERSAGWRRPAQIRTRLAGPWAPALQGLSAQLLERAADDLRQGGPAQGWVASARPWQPASRYEAALLGAAEPDTDWSIELVLLPATVPDAQDPPTRWRRVWAAQALEAQSPWGVRLEMHWVDHRDPQRRRVWARDFVLGGDQRWEATPFLAHAGAELGRQLLRWQAELDLALACQPLAFAVSTQPDGWVLQATPAHGVKVGDRVVLMDRSQLPERVLEPQALSALAMAEVRAVGARGAQLRWLAGPSLPASGDWVAVPVHAGAAL